MATWLERDEEGRTTRSFACRTQCVHLGVRSAERFVPAFAEEIPFGINNDGADHRIRFDATLSAPRQFESATHHGFEIGEFYNHAGRMTAIAQTLGQTALLYPL